ncbi:protein FAR1-RELATED SEQUENCE 4-like [Arachis stenosperma]|uniref:protein FAR1-RELATED SEQUENCE 4-like n=1 Tax=Arachis stenosperma TaxID=217475 RepID=UPI0025AD3630|nr:protein FAR1-RELATED SEQUENCE 4-like [Arachis stenosperma]
MPLPIRIFTAVFVSSRSGSKSRWVVGAVLLPRASRSALSSPLTSNAQPDLMGTTNNMWDNDDACQENAYTRNGSKNVDQDTTYNTTESEFFYRDMGKFGDVEGIHMEDIMKKVFRTDEDAYKFYKKFGKYHGFGVRKRDSWKDEDGIVTRRRFFCNRQRLRDAKHYNRLDRMRGFTNQKRGLIARRSSPYPLTRVLLCGERVTIAEGDAEAALAYLEDKTESDPMAMAWYSLTDDGMLGNMFWADGGSRVDYQYFGDVLAFDATYKKNKYRRPLVIFSGANNHKQTTIFSFGLVMDETFDSYKWILQNMLEVMCMKEPSVVVTNGDEAMCKAIALVFPKFKLQDSLWARQVFGKKEMWVNAYLRNKFCAGFKTTSRCEGINAVVKNFLQSKYTILELVQNLELMVRDYRNNELLVQFRTIDTFLVMTTSLDAIERFAMLTYTKEVFADIKREIQRVAVVNLVRVRRSLNTRVYSLEEYESPGRLILVLFDRNMGRLKCRCEGWTKYEYPCRHLFLS